MGALTNLRLPTLVLVQVRQTHVLLISQVVIVIDLILTNEIVRSQLGPLLPVGRIRGLLLVGTFLGELRLAQNLLVLWTNPVIGVVVPLLGSFGQREVRLTAYEIVGLSSRIAWQIH